MLWLYTYVIEACQVQFHAVYTSALDGLGRSLSHDRFTNTERVADTERVGGLECPYSAWEWSRPQQAARAQGGSG
jgi:hypothetical protein